MNLLFLLIFLKQAEWICHNLQESFLPVIKFSASPPLVLQLHSLQDGAIEMISGFLLGHNNLFKSLFQKAEKKQLNNNNTGIFGNITPKSH